MELGIIIIIIIKIMITKILADLLFLRRLNKVLSSVKIGV
jgi:hypothetical protein